MMRTLPGPSHALGGGDRASELDRCSPALDLFLEMLRVTAPRQLDDDARLGDLRLGSSPC